MGSARRSIVTTVIHGSWGPVLLATGDRGVVALEILSTPESFLARLRRRGLPDPVELAGASRGPGATLAAAARDLVGRYLAGEPVGLESLPVDLDDRPAWDRLVLGAVHAVPRGEVVSYGEVARRIGRAGAARAVGGAVGRNPVGLLVPCHRVIAGDGSLGGYGVAAWGGREAALAVKRALLALEGLHVDGVGRLTPRV